jgi:hypothetical protein
VADSTAKGTGFEMKPDRRSLPEMKSFADAVSLCDSERDKFYTDAFMLQAWIGRLLDQAIADYGDQRRSHARIMQFGQAQRAFLQVFGNATDQEFQSLLHNCHRFTGYDDPLAEILLQAVVPHSIEHECSGDFSGARALDRSRRPREALALMRQSVERWSDWVDAVVHLQTHALWHLAPECFAPGRDRRDWAGLGIQCWFAGRMSDPRKLKLSARNFAADAPLTEAALNDHTARYRSFQPRRTWPHPELDEAVISLWPLLQRHNWTFGDLLNVLRDILPRSDIYPCESERNLATYCAFSLRLRKFGHGKTTKDSRPAGYEVALRLCQPQAPSVPRIQRFGPPEESTPPAPADLSQDSAPRQMVFDCGFDF